jgi:hypothetical protein
MNTQKPFLSSDVPVNRGIVRAATASVLAALQNQHPSEIVQKSWPQDRAAAFIVNRGAVSPTSTTEGAALAATAISSYIAGLAPVSGAARLIASGVRVDLSGIGVASVPRLSLSGGGFVAEGEPIGVHTGTTTAGAIGPVKKFAILTVLSEELLNHSTPDAEALVELALREAAALQLDAALFSDVAADDERPAGLLAGVTPVASAAGGGQGALLEDIQNLIDPISAAGAGTNVFLFCSPGRRARLKILGGPGLDLPIVPVAGLDPDMVIALDPSGFISGFSGEPEIAISSGATLHMNTEALPLVADGSPGGIPGGVRSLWQTQTISLKLILRVALTTRASGLVQLVEDVSW